MSALWSERSSCQSEPEHLAKSGAFLARTVTTGASLQVNADQLNHRR
jgi:hypothetical protein